ncbi:MAG: YkgJ family cysteine cluster protein [Methanomicrobiaceae archaeon]|nr:YkgJ family cysteine cluster protein [Methanomicrobiaceae archaeon]
MPETRDHEPLQHHPPLLHHSRHHVNPGKAMPSITTLRGITEKIEDLSRQRDDLVRFPDEELAGIIRDVGFSCTGCARCCTREFNGHVFLLDDDVEQCMRIDAGALIPAPGFELCDQHGNFYVSGYVLRCREDGDCIFLEGTRCRIYAQRFRICRIYPYMLHREWGDDGRYEWRQIAGLNEHGEYHAHLSAGECRRIAAETISYEKDFLEKEIAFYTFCTAFFKEHNLRPVRKVYDQQMRRFQHGEAVTVYVFDRGALKRHRVTRDAY